jgi:hypothetical protein
MDVLEKRIAAIIAGATLVLYLVSGRRWSDEGRLRRWLKRG